MGYLVTPIYTGQNRTVTVILAEVLETVTKKFKPLMLISITLKDTRPRCLLTSVVTQMEVSPFLIWKHQLFILILKYCPMFAHSNPSPSQFIIKLSEMPHFQTIQMMCFLIILINYVRILSLRIEFGTIYAANR